MTNPLKEAARTALSLKGPEAVLDAAVSRADSMASRADYQSATVKGYEVRLGYKGHDASIWIDGRHVYLSQGEKARLVKAAKEKLGIKADSATAEQADRVALRSEMKGHPYKDASELNEFSDRELQRMLDAGNLSASQERQVRNELNKRRRTSRKDAVGEPISREQMEEQAEALRERIRSARSAMAEQTIEDMEADLAELEAKLGEEGDEEDEADGKPDGAKLDAILNKVDSMKGKK